MNNNQRSSTISFIGKPNAGKSTLMNSLVGNKISIVTPKVQTTRSIIKGILTEDQVQLILVDTPGIFDAKKTLEKAMVRCAWSSIMGTDEVALLIDSSRGLDDSIKLILKRLEENKVQPLILLNKKDLVKDEQLLSLRQEISDIITPKAIFDIAATNRNSCKNFIDYLKQEANNPGWFYDEEEMTTAPIRFLASEITREKLFMRLQQELPYNLMVDTESWEERPDGSVKVNQVIYVTKDSYKKIVLGQAGQNIKLIGQKSREDMQRNLGVKVHLFLFVKVRAKWTSDSYLYERMGLKKDG